MTPLEFIRKWKPVALSERAAAQSHFIDLCRVFGHPDPVADDPTGERFTFEKGAAKSGGGDGFADVWKRGFFAWEYKKKKFSLDEAMAQLVKYAAALENPPLQVACDTDRFVIRTAWTNTIVKTYRVALEDLGEPEKFGWLHAVFHDPEKLRPATTRASITREAADKFSTIALRLQGRGTPEDIAHFVNQLVFCFFADSVKLLPEGLIGKLLKHIQIKPRQAKESFDKLFAAMEKGGELDFTDIAWFNGGLFDGRRALPLDDGDVALLVAAASQTWSEIDPTIFGTLFERFLDPDKRAQIGAHYTDPEKIMMILDPVLVRPLGREWQAVKAEIKALLAGAAKPPKRADGRGVLTPTQAAEETRSRFLERLRALSILDPACGSGNFLYLALQAVKDLELKANQDCEECGLPARASMVGPEILHGIEINPLAAELARSTIWIGDIQWGIRHALYTRPEPILRTLDAIECRDALIAPVAGAGEGARAGEGAGAWAEAAWPAAEFIVGNPPFLGGKLLRRGLGDDYVARLFDIYAGRVPPEADLVTYWFDKARAEIVAGQAQRAGLVSTNSIRGGANRKVLERVAADAPLFEAWSDEPWVVEGAAVRVSLVCFAEAAAEQERRLDGEPVADIEPDLVADGIDLTKTKRLAENAGIAFMGDTKGGAFDIPGSLARAWLREPLNPNGRPNSDVLRPWVNGLDLTRRPRDMWIVDFGWTMSESEASLYEAPFAHISDRVRSERVENRRATYAKSWWRHIEPRPALLSALKNVEHYIVTPRVSKHRLFVTIAPAVLNDSATIAIARDDDTTFGILHSRFHEAWSLRLGTWLGVGNDPRYTPTTTFETFPFPAGLTPDIPAAAYAADPRAMRIAKAARRLDDLRRAWLNPPDLVRVEPEVVPGYPDRILPKDAQAAATLKERTLTKLYNKRPQWLADAHDALDRAVAAAYGWPEDIATAGALANLLALNLARPPSGRAGFREKGLLPGEGEA